MKTKNTILLAMSMIALAATVVEADKGRQGRQGKQRQIVGQQAEPNDAGGSPCCKSKGKGKGKCEGGDCGGKGKRKGKGAGRGQGHGMTADVRDTLHGLFDSHDKFHREINVTDDGYTSKTTSEDPTAVKLIQKHVKQMESRLKAGMMVRRWDPAYEEFVNYYDDIDIEITNIKNGISIVAVGKTDDARKVARNHAGIISKFVKSGWEEHDKIHPAVLANTGTSEAGAGSDATGGKEVGQQAKTGRPCCLAKQQAAGSKSCCKKAKAAK